MSWSFIIHYGCHQTLMPRENKLLAPPARAREDDQYFIPRHSSDIWIAHVSYLCQLKWIQPIRTKCILNDSPYLVRKHNHSWPPSFPNPSSHDALCMNHLWGRGQQGRKWDTDTLGFTIVLLVIFADTAFFSDSSSVLIPCFWSSLVILAILGDHTYHSGLWLC